MNEIDPCCLQGLGDSVIAMVEVVVLPQMDGDAFEELLSRFVPVFLATPGDYVLTDELEHPMDPLVDIRRVSHPWQAVCWVIPRRAVKILA